MDLVNLYNQGLNCREIAPILGISRHTVANRLKRAGVDILPGNKYRFNERYFQYIDTEEKAYWLGMLAADGNIHKSSRRGTYKITLSLKEEKPDHLRKFLNDIGSNKPVQTRKDQFRATASSKYFECDLIPKGIVECKSLILMPPVGVPDNLISHWIRGYFDGDGSVYFSKDGKIKVTFAGTHEICEFINSQVNNCGNIHKNKNIFMLRFQSKNSTKIIEDYLYYNATIFLERKYLKFRQRSKY